MISHVISDLGGVLLFFDNDIFFKKMEYFCSYTTQQISNLVHIHFDLIKSFDSGKITPEKFYAEATRILNSEIDIHSFFSAYNDVFWLNPPVFQFMERLKGKFHISLLSNTDVERFGFVKNKFPEIFIFDDYVLSYEEGFIKPYPEIYLRAIERLNVKAEECIFIDDLPLNIQAAREIGMNTVLYNPQVDLEAELKIIKE